MDKRIQCPVCGKEGVLQWKETVTKVKGKTYRYKKLYVYHWNPKKPKWCYLNKEHLKALGITKNDLTQKRNTLTQNTHMLTQKDTPNNTNLKNIKLSSIQGKKRARSSARKSPSSQSTGLLTRWSRVQFPAGPPSVLGPCFD